MKIGSSLKTKSYLIMAPLVGLFLLLTFAMVHATWQIRGEVAQVENEASDALWSGRLARASDRYRADYWELLSTGKTSEQEQVGEDAAEVEAIIEHFREENEAAGDHADVARLQSFAKEFASAKASVDAAARYLTNTDAAASRSKAGEEAGRILVQATGPARDLAVVSEREVERATADLAASSKAIFGRSSAMCRTAEQLIPEAHEIALVQRVILGFGAELTDFAHYAALRDGSASFAERLYETRYRHAETVAALDDLEKSEQNESDAAGKELVDTIRKRYEVVTSLSRQVTNLPAMSPSQRRSELEDQLESQVNSLHASMDELAALQAADLRHATDRLRATLRQTEAMIAGLWDFSCSSRPVFPICSCIKSWSR